MKHKNDLKIKIDKEPRKKENILKRIVIIAILLLIVIFVLNKAENYLKEKTANEINLVLNNKNVTANLKHEIIEENGNIYMSMDDIKNYFDKYINIEDEINEIVTTYDKQIASIGFETNKLTLNGATKKIYAHAIKKDDVIYMPIVEMKDVYNLETTIVENNVILDSLTRKQVKAYAKSNLSVKWKADFFSKTVDKIERGDVVVAIEEKDGWTRIRTENGNVGFVKSTKLTNYTTTRDDWEEEKQITGKVNMFWDYYSKYVQAPDRTGQVIEGVNVVSPTFFYIDSNGNLKNKIGESGKKYIEWAHSNGYKVWPAIQHDEAGIKVTSTILNSYTKRQEIIENIKVVTEKLIEQERKARKFLAKDTLDLEDTIYRSYGLLSNCRKISLEEAQKLISNVKMGTDLGILPELNDSKVQQLNLYTKPANMQKYLGEQYEALERDIKRAEVIKKIMS